MKSVSSEKPRHQCSFRNSQQRKPLGVCKFHFSRISFVCFDTHFAEKHRKRPSDRRYKRSTSCDVSWSAACKCQRGECNSVTSDGLYHFQAQVQKWQRKKKNSLGRPGWAPNNLPVGGRWTCSVVNSAWKDTFSYAAISPMHWTDLSGPMGKNGVAQRAVSSSMSPWKFSCWKAGRVSRQ